MWWTARKRSASKTGGCASRWCYLLAFSKRIRTSAARAQTPRYLRTGIGERDTRGYNHQAQYTVANDRGSSNSNLPLSVHDFSPIGLRTTCTITLRKKLSSPSSCSHARSSGGSGSFRGNIVDTYHASRMVETARACPNCPQNAAD